MKAAPASIDWSSNELIAVRELVPRLPPRRDGTRVAATTVAGWYSKEMLGCLLPSVKIAGRVFIRPRLLRNFAEARALKGRPIF
ncbi:MAG: hypothetical protein JNM18_18135 [Planctomycetaceae bacterium]|nr:hypothetical protein [Planctomycetaceae bacterium]